jgi:hypothetical protein
VNDEPEHPSFLKMVGLVAMGVGYLFGRVFL